jgi:AcrR family transcriptional regulator
MTKPQRPVKGIQEEVRNASLERRRQSKEALREKILKEAGSLFLQEGYEAFSMRKVASRIGYSATTIYHHFQDKDALLMALLGEAFCGYSQYVSDALAGKESNLDRLEALGHAYVRFALENPLHYRMMFIQRPDYILEREMELARQTTNGYAQLVGLVEAVQSEGGFPGRTSESVANALWAMTHGLALLGLTAFCGRLELVTQAHEVIDDLVRSAFPEKKAGNR